MDRNSKILTGCGIGCGVVVIIAIVVGIIGYNFISDKVEHIEKFEKTVKKLENKYEDYDSYYPSGNLLLEENTMVTFLEIRDSLKLKSPYFIKSMQTISKAIKEKEDSGEDDEESVSSVLGMISTGFSAIPEIEEFFIYRDHLLDKFNMPIGEYFYYFVMSYYVEQGVDLGDGPNFPVPGNSHGQDFSFDGRQQNDHEKFIREVKESRADDISIRTNKFMLKIFNNILENSDNNNKTIIENEVDLLRKDKYRIPFDGKKPDFITQFFERYKPQLSENYIDLLNPLELNPIKNDRERRRKREN